GVVGDTRDAGLGSAALPTVYIPLAVMPTWPMMSFVIRSSAPATELSAGARRAIRELNPDLPVRDLRTMEEVLASAVAPARWSSLLLGTFAGIALLIAVIGVFGVLSFVVTQQTRELGIRLALGATPSQVRRMVALRGLGMAAVGLVIGVLGAWWLTRFMGSLLYGVQATDPLTYIAVSAVLGGAAFIASYIPAHRATRVDPLMALRAE
ncbi:MAG: FtsX-like permease family protein, partial [Gemmatimonadaceae bacterium]